MSDTQTIGAMIRHERTGKNLTQSELASRLTQTMGTAYYQTTVGRIENGERTLSLGEAAALSIILDIAVSDLAAAALPDDFDELGEKIVRFQKSVHVVVQEAEDLIRDAGSKSDGDRIAEVRSEVVRASDELKAILD